MKKWSCVGTAAATLASVAILGMAASPAGADTRCDMGKEILINGNPGAEDPSWAMGHSHNTGNHYLGGIDSNLVWSWWADNNGGNDGDTWDTHYGYRQC
ncbi:hypothetical protein ACFRCG_39240 [Embleya sp. NPDC056575]|uniref:hypothetical protein n=1 Tax=unclassified Embleya TaxID=2699296 RepID=UPI00368DD958